MSCRVSRWSCLVFRWIALLFTVGVCNPVLGEGPLLEGQAAFDYLKQLEGEWGVDGGNEGVFGWKLEVTARGSTVIERLKVGTPTEMTTVYHLDRGTLIVAHYCQLSGTSLD